VLLKPEPTTAVEPLGHLCRSTGTSSSQPAQASATPQHINSLMLPSVLVLHKFQAATGQLRPARTAQRACRSTLQPTQAPHKANWGPQAPQLQQRSLLCLPVLLPTVAANGRCCQRSLCLPVLLPTVVAVPAKPLQQRSLLCLPLLLTVSVPE
jgi:hypothetical protein